MAKETARAHIVMPPELLESVDQLVGRRGRSKFVMEAVEERLARLRLARAAEAAAGTLAEVEIPGWESSEAAAEWVSASRRADERGEDQNGGV